MKSRNDILAEYVRIRYPHIEREFDFIGFTIKQRIGCIEESLRSFGTTFNKAIKNLALATGNTQTNNNKRSHRPYQGRTMHRGPKPLLAGYGYIDQITMEAMTEAGLDWWDVPNREHA